VLDIVRATEGRYAITGVPCFHKALRLLRRQDPVLDRRIRYQIGIVCGQMKSAHYVEYLAATAGAAGTLTDACFRRKVDGYPADDYAFEARFQPADGAGAEEVARVMNSRIGVNWGMGYFKPTACDVCDDVLAETADVAVMDAWLPQYVRDGQGWSLVVVRSEELATLHAQARAVGRIVSEPVTPAQVADSQRGGFNHRRAGLGYRLWLMRGGWTPVKRIPATPDLPALLKIEQRLRSWLRQRSRTVWLAVREQDSAAPFRQRMRWPERIYKVVQRLKRKLRVPNPAPRNLAP
jgi:hypothetical protein